MDLPAPEDDFDRRLLADVEQFGWHCVRVSDEGVSEEEGEQIDPMFRLGVAYTVGLTHTWGAPELIIVGVPWPAAHTWLSNVVSDLHDGLELTDGVVIEEDGTKLSAVSELARKRYMTYADWATHRAGFEALQVLVPDAEGNLPGDGYRGPPQPVLAQFPVGF